MDWALAIDRNRAALTAILAALYAMLGLGAGGSVARTSRFIRCAVLHVLRPAEAAARRLVVIAARGLTARPAPARTMPARRIIAAGPRRPGTAFRLFDRRKDFSRRPGVSTAQLAVPRIRFVESAPLLAAAPPAAATSPAEDGVDAGPLCRRLEALRQALDDLPGQARRLLRLEARRARAPRLRLVAPLRPGHPPGWRRSPVRDVDFVLAECHGLARDVLDTS